MTFWNWDREIIMTMCEMETSVYHFAISTLLHFPGFYPVSELCFYQMVCFYFFFFHQLSPPVLFES